MNRVRECEEDVPLSTSIESSRSQLRKSKPTIPVYTKELESEVAGRGGLFGVSNAGTIGSESSDKRAAATALCRI